MIANYYYNIECLAFYLCPKCNKKETHPHKLILEKRHQDATEALIKKDNPSFMQTVRYVLILSL